MFHFIIWLLCLFLRYSHSGQEPIVSLRVGFELLPQLPDTGITGVCLDVLDMEKDEQPDC